MPRKPRQVYDVCRAQDGALVICGVDLATARSEKARLNAEAAVVNPETRQPTGMFLGELVTYEARSREGLIL